MYWWGHLVEAIRWDETGAFVGYRASGPARLAQSLCSTTRDRPGSSGCLRRQGPSIMRISRCLGRAGAEHHAHQRVFGEGRGRASCPSAGVWGGQGPSIMRIGGCLGRAGAEHHAHQRVWGASNPVQSKSNEIKFRWTCEKQSTGGGEGGEGVLQVIRIRIERTLTGKQQL